VLAWALSAARFHVGRHDHDAPPQKHVVAA
jgi:hypothetical protein